MKTTFLLAFAISTVAYSQSSFAGSITDTYTTGDTLTATKINNVKSAVNDNDTRITAVEGEDTTQNNQISAVEGKNVTQDARLNALEIESANQAFEISEAPRVTTGGFGIKTRIVAGCVDFKPTTPIGPFQQPDPNCGSGYQWFRRSNNEIVVAFLPTFNNCSIRPTVTANVNILAGYYVTIRDNATVTQFPWPSCAGFTARVCDTNAGGDCVTAVVPFSFIAIGRD